MNAARLPLLALLLAAAGMAGDTVARRHPFLANGVLLHARIAPLPTGVIARSGEVAMTGDGLARAIQSVPPFVRDELARDPFPLVEEHFGRRLLVALALADAEAAEGEPPPNQDAALARYLDRKLAQQEPTEDDLRLFFEQNRAAFGPMDFEQVKGHLAQLVANQQRDEQLHDFLRELGRDQPIEVAAEWIEKHAAAALDNPIDRLRGRGKPVLAAFGGDGCCGPDRSKPLLEQIGQAAPGAAEIVHLDVRQHQALAMRHRVAGIPTILVFHASGEEQIRHQGEADAETVLGWIEGAKAD